MKSTPLFVTLALGLCVAGTLFAQTPASAPQHREFPGQKLHEFLLKKFDADHDGKLNEAERDAAMEQLKVKCPELFAKADTDHDGSLSPEERQAIKEIIRTHVLEKFDVDRDGKLNEQERQTAKEAFIQRLKAHRGPKA